MEHLHEEIGARLAKLERITQALEDSQDPDPVFDHEAAHDPEYGTSKTLLRNVIKCLMFQHELSDNTNKQLEAIAKDINYIKLWGGN